MNDTTILVVDDEPQIRRVLRVTLSSNGYGVIEAKDGEEAIATVIRDRPDLILLDVNMPGMSGFEVCSKIRLSFSRNLSQLGRREMKSVRIGNCEKVSQVLLFC